MVSDEWLRRDCRLRGRNRVAGKLRRWLQQGVAVRRLTVGNVAGTVVIDLVGDGERLDGWTPPTPGVAAVGGVNPEGA